MVMAVLGDINGDCKTTPVCSGSHFKLNEFFDPIKHGSEKFISATEKVETSSITWGRILLLLSGISTKHIMISV